MSNEPKVLIADLAETMPLTMLGNLPCPFCGSTNLSRITYTGKGEADHTFIQCERCLAAGPSRITADSEAAWNARAFGPEIFIRPQDAKALTA